MTQQHNYNKRANIVPELKIPPQSVELEEAILGACMLEKDAFAQVLGIIHTSECFYVDAHKKIYAAMRRLFDKGAPVDLLTITDELRKSNELDIVGGAYSLSKLTMSVVSSAHVEAHARIVYEKFMLREIIRVTGNALNEAYSGITDPFELSDVLNKSISDIQAGVPTEHNEHIGVVFQDMLMEIETQMENKSDVTGVTSGYVDIDAKTHGWQNKNLIVLAARPSQGKTALALNFALNAAENGTEVLIFSLETAKTKLMQRWVSAKSGIDFEKIQSGRLTGGEYMSIQSLYSHFNKLSIQIDDETFGVERICAIARKWAKNRDKKLIIIDYLQLMEINLKGANREQQVSTMTRTLKKLAVELDCPLMALSQLNRGVENKADKKPGLADLRESGAIEQDANVVLMIWWEVTDIGKKTWIIIPKNRDGKTGEVELKFNGDIQRWVDVNDNMRPVAASYIETQYAKGKSSKGDWDEDWETPIPDNPYAGISGYQSNPQKLPENFFNEP